MPCRYSSCIRSGRATGLCGRQDPDAVSLGFVGQKVRGGTAAVFHDVLRPDGSPYDANETEFIKMMTGK